MNSDYLCVMLCCNDHQNGNFAGELYAVEVSDLVSLHGPLNWGPKLAIEDDHIKIARKKFPKRGHGNWVGNWCWDSVWMKKEDIVILLNWLNKKKWFSCEEAYLPISRAWDTATPITIDMLVESGEEE